MKPRVLRRSRVSSRSESDEVLFPATSTVPLVATSTQPIRLSRVVLPLPDGPAMEMNSPLCTSSDTPRSAGTTTLPSVYSFTTSRIETMLGIFLRLLLHCRRCTIIEPARFFFYGAIHGQELS